jgi:predicted O-methyltransferase YrrM
VPSLYQLFLFNMKHEGLDDRVLPVWNFTRWGSRMLAHWGVVADLIYVDAAHDEEFVWADLNDYWPLLRRGGVMFGDDLTYPGVAAALGRFVEKEGVVLNKTDGQWWILKGA